MPVPYYDSFTGEEDVTITQMTGLEHMMAQITELAQRPLDKMFDVESTFV